jgi:hypothetical protein
MGVHHLLEVRHHQLFDAYEIAPRPEQPLTLDPTPRKAVFHRRTILSEELPGSGAQ